MMKVRCLLVLLLLIGLAFPAEAWADEEPATVAVFKLSGPVTEKPTAEDFPFAMSGMGESLKTLLDRMQKAEEDDEVKAVVLLIGNVSMGRAQLQEIRRAMERLKKAGKPIHVHLDTATMGQYTLASGASRISMVPTGYLFITGMFGEQLYLRGLLDKLGVKPDFFTKGDYKSAAETFMRKGPSPEADEMTNWLFDGLYEEMVSSIAKGRGVKAATVKEWIDHGVFLAGEAKEKGIIDAVEQRQDFEAYLRKTYGEDLKLVFKYGKKKGPTIDLSSPLGVLNFYAQLLQPPKRARSDQDSVAIVYLEGPIMQGTKSRGLFAMEGAYSTTIRKHLDKVAEDDSIKAVVFRVNSPGGSGVASEIILDATRRVAAKKPLVVSMGTVAGSGGYYVACGTETIFADASTITGSIGVVAGKFATTEMWKKIGVTWKPYQRGKNAGMLGTADVFSPSERAAMQGYMDKVYDVFKKTVTDIRGDRLTKPIDEIAGGRVYTGRQALELGLVDKIGGLTDAVAFAAKQAELEDYEVRVVPRPKNFLEQMLSGFGLDDSEKNDRLTLRGANGTMALWKKALPHLEGLEPRRVKAVIEALRIMSLTQEERVMMVMPVISN